METDSEACPRCKQSPEERKRDHKTKHVERCRGSGRRVRAELAAIVASAPSAEAITVPAAPISTSAKRITQQVREGLMSVFEGIGGEQALLEWAQKNPSTFFQMWARAVPRESESANRAAGITVIVAGASELRERRGRLIEVSAESA